MRISLFLVLLMTTSVTPTMAQNAEAGGPVLHAECRSQALARYDPGDVGRPLTWRRRVGEAYNITLEPDEEGRFIGNALHIPSNGEAVQYSSSFDWKAASVLIDDQESGFAHLLIRLVNNGSGPVYDALAIKPARSGPQLIRYSCSFTCNDRPLKNLLPETCPVKR